MRCDHFWPVFSSDMVYFANVLAHKLLREDPAALSSATSTGLLIKDSAKDGLWVTKPAISLLIFN